ncbi:MAG TPA: hypothetical protein VKH19_06115 [Gemmatimonadaceae bacterium]|nr:hypothetical protein [Gemmatimonadaceae bacterium]
MAPNTAAPANTPISFPRSSVRGRCMATAIAIDGAVSNPAGWIA